jgi:uncharacterized protein YjbI with pentapeptide repeats
MDTKYQVLSGNEYLKTGQIVAPFNITSRGAYIDNCDIIVTMRHLRPLGEGDKLWSVSQCLTEFYKNWNLGPLLNYAKYSTIDGADLTGTRQHDVRMKGVIYNNCNLNDVSFHGGTLNKVVFLNCDIDILDLRHAALIDVLFLHCNKTYGIKLDNVKPRRVIFKKTSHPKDLKSLGFTMVKNESQDYFWLKKEYR